MFLLKSRTAIQLFGDLFTIIGFLFLSIYCARYVVNRYEVFVISQNYADSYNPLSARKNILNPDKAESSILGESDFDESNDIKRIVIPAVGIDREVVPGTVIDDIWDTSDTEVNYLSGSGFPEQGGNIVIYGHNHKSIFGNIRYLEKGDLITIVDQNENIYTYEVIEIDKVTPDNLQYVHPTSSETLTLYTCTDLFGTKRHFVIAKRV